jgi:hypothetical protein
MRICIIGNSHAAALKLALGRSSVIGNCTFDFYVVPGGHGPQLTLDGGRLRPLAADGPIQSTVPGAVLNGLDLGPFDALVVSACGLVAARNENVVPNPACHPLGTVFLANCVATGEMPAPAGKQFASIAVFEAVVESYVRQHASTQFARLLAGSFRGKVLLQPWPVPNRALRENSSWFINVAYGSAGQQVWHDFVLAQYHALEAVTAELGSSFTLLPYPLPDPLREGFVAAELCETDPWHGNEKYGELVLTQVCERLA